MISEAIGMLPKQLCRIQMPMLGKPTGVNRLIILYPGMRRIWQRARRSMVSGAIDSLDRKFWGASRGRSAIDCARLQAVRAEANQAEALHSALW
eukprot:2432461-Pyramimonas_sp.AAC.1